MSLKKIKKMILSVKDYLILMSPGLLNSPTVLQLLNITFIYIVVSLDRVNFYLHLFPLESLHFFVLFQH